MTYVPLQGEEGWLALVDDELLFRIQSLASDHAHDEELVAIVRWARPAPRGGFLFGVSFDGIRPEEQRVVAGVVDEFRRRAASIE